MTQINRKWVKQKTGFKIIAINALDHNDARRHQAAAGYELCGAADANVLAIEAKCCSYEKHLMHS